MKTRNLGGLHFKSYYLESQLEKLSVVQFLFLVFPLVILESFTKSECFGHKGAVYTAGGDELGTES